jgi:hypothetical protein
MACCDQKENFCDITSQDRTINRHLYKKLMLKHEYVLGDKTSPKAVIFQQHLQTIKRTPSGKSLLGASSDIKIG